MLGIDWEATRNHQPGSRFRAVRRVNPRFFPQIQKSGSRLTRLGLANTAAEAVAALLTASEVDQDLLNALQSGILSQTVTAADLPYNLHERCFGHVSGGRGFLIRPEADQTTAIKPVERSNSSGAQSIPPNLQQLLGDLNAKQQRLDQLARRLEECRWQVYALWYLSTDRRKKGVTRGTPEALNRLQLENNLTSLKTRSRPSSRCGRLPGKTGMPP